MAKRKKSKRPAKSSMTGWLVLGAGLVGAFVIGQAIGRGIGRAIGSGARQRLDGGTSP